MADFVPQDVPRKRKTQKRREERAERIAERIREKTGNTLFGKTLAFLVQAVLSHDPACW